jgi:hypothetical protein
MASIFTAADVVGLAVAGLAVLATVVCSWRGSRGWVTAAAAIAGGDVALALVRARVLGAPTPATRVALAAGLAAVIALMIRFGVAGVYGRLVPDHRDRDGDDR